MMETSTFPGSSERRIVQSPLSACPRSAVASPNTAPPTIRISPITRLKFMVLLPFPALLGFLENSRLLEGDQFVERQVLRSEEHTSELQSRSDLVCRLLLEKKKNY